VNPDALTFQRADFHQCIDITMFPLWIIGESFLLQESEVGKIELCRLLWVKETQKELKALMQEFFEQPVVVDLLWIRLNVFRH
jgi:hypothetical protein